MPYPASQPEPLDLRNLKEFRIQNRLVLDMFAGRAHRVWPDPDRDPHQARLEPHIDLKPRREPRLRNGLRRRNALRHRKGRRLRIGDKAPVAQASPAPAMDCMIVDRLMPPSQGTSARERRAASASCVRNRSGRPKATTHRARAPARRRNWFRQWTDPKS